ncbi:MAG TPA: TldD/PmbA family protein [Nitrospirales bacterium]|nr:TldD/PmbA family protein [Nitrospirales bacterium]
MPTIPKVITTDLVEAIKNTVVELTAEAPDTYKLCRYADLRIEVTEEKHAGSENGTSKYASEDSQFACGIRVLAGDGAIAPGYFGQVLGKADLPRLAQTLASGLQHAYQRAVLNAREKIRIRDKYKDLGAALSDTRLASVEVHRDTVKAEYAIDPRRVCLDDMVRYVTEVSRAVQDVDEQLKYNAVSAVTLVTRELFTSSEGACIDQSFALTTGTAYVVAVSETGDQELSDAIGHQRGWEVVTEGVVEEHIRNLDLLTFSTNLARDAVKLAHAPPLRSSDKDVVVITDPHFNALLAHEIIGHPTELDRALKMETAYAGRSWLLRALNDTMVGKAVASPLVSAYSDPSLPGFGHYKYDHEGTPGRKVVHIEKGLFKGFMNNRQTAAILNVPPNGSCMATEAHLVPLVRMSTTVFAAGARAPEDIIREVDKGYYVVGHRIPSIAESRENFRISAQKVYEIRNGQIGQLYRGGGIMADTKTFLMKVDAMGRDFRLFPIPNCGKGQPMQGRRLGNGGPTIRSRAHLTGPA